MMALISSSRLDFTKPSDCRDLPPSAIKERVTPMVRRLFFFEEVRKKFLNPTSLFARRVSSSVIMPSPESAPRG